MHFYANRIKKCIQKQQPRSFCGAVIVGLKAIAQAHQSLK